MNRPGLHVYLIGNRLSLLVAIGYFGYVVLYWVAHQPAAQGYPVFISLMVLIYVVYANTQLAHFKAWKKEWASIASGGTLQPKSTRKGFACVMLCVVVWMAMGGWLVLSASASDLPVYDNVARAFVALSALGCGSIAYVIVRFFVRLGNKIYFALKARRERNHVVTVCLSVPRHSPTWQEFTAALPDYCAFILNHKHSVES